MEIRFNWPEIYSSVLSENSAPEKLPRAVSRRIERDIRAAGLGPGAVFGTTHTLRERYDIGRETLLQAARLLEERGVAKMRRGPCGGLIALGRNRDDTAPLLARYLHRAGTSAAQIEEARSAFALIDAAVQTGANGSTRSFDAAFHTRIGGARAPRLRGGGGGLRPSGRLNPALRPLAEAMERLTADEGPISGAAAEQRTAPPDLVAIAADYLTEQIARQRALGTSRLGCEADLSERVGVSRQVFRQATRLLEDRGLIACRRGRCNGLFATAVHPAAVVNALVDHFTEAGLANAAFRPVLSMLERINRVCFALRALPEHFDAIERLLAGQNWNDPSQHILRFHIEWALLDNPVLSLLEQALSAYRSRRAGQGVLAALGDIDIVKRNVFEHLARMRRGDFVGADAAYVAFHREVTAMLGTY